MAGPDVEHMAARDTEAGIIPEDLKAIHVLNRLSLGPRPRDLERTRRIGIEHHVHEQLNPESIPEPESLVREIRALDTIRMSPVELFKKYQVLLIQARKESKSRSGTAPLPHIGVSPTRSSTRSFPIARPPPDS